MQAKNCLHFFIIEYYFFSFENNKVMKNHKPFYSEEQKSITPTEILKREVENDRQK